ncbi:MAG: glycoside hydrolase family 99-like domain-containing protein [Chloroflexota bacterium]
MLIARLLLSLVVLLSAFSTPPPAASAAQPARPLLAFYYSWFDMNTWDSGLVADQPTQRYNSYERSTIERHVGMARQAGIDGFIQAWLGPNNPTDANLGTLLSVAEGSDFSVSLYFETDSPFLRSRAAVVEALRRAISFTSHPNWVRKDGKPVIFFWRPAGVVRSAGQSGVEAWRSLRQEVDPNHETLWIGEGDDFSYLSVFDGIHPYSVAWSSDPAGTLSTYGQRTHDKAAQLGQAKLWVPVAMPGYDDRRLPRSDAFARSREDGAYFARTFEGALASRPDWAILINSFNEWCEGSMIEPSVTYGNKYLDLARGFSARFKTNAAPPPAATGAPASGEEFSIPGGRFFRQTGPGDGRGFAVTDAEGVPFWNEFQRLGGPQVVGYPLSRRFQWDGLVTQVFQKAVFQWKPAEGRVDYINVFDQLAQAGRDDWLLSQKSTPRPLDGAAFDAGKSWGQVIGSRQALLRANAAISSVYHSVPDPLALFGLPTSEVVDNGDHYAVRLQRAVIQQWKADCPWAKAGQATIANGGDILVQAGLVPNEYLAPETP